MKIIRPIYFVMLVFVALTTSSAFALNLDASPEATEEVRLVAAKEKLDKEPNTIVLYAKGLCCPSCAIGVRKKISKLKFVDHSRFNKGVELDTKTQLVTVAIADNKKIDLKRVSQAVQSAGYTPVRSYKIVKEQLISETLPSEETKN